MTLTATQVSGNEYSVSGTYGGRTLEERTVFVKPGQGASDAVSIMEGIIDGPDAATISAMNAQKRVENVKRECRRRIYAIADPDAQINLASARAAGLLTTAQNTTYASGLTWITSMRATCATLAISADDFYDDAEWPSVPSGVADLAALF